MSEPITLVLADAAPVTVTVEAVVPAVPEPPAPLSAIFIGPSIYPSGWESQEQGLGAEYGYFQTADSVTVVAVGGSGPKTFTWSSIPNVGAASPNSATTKLAFSLTPGATISGILTCEISDETGSISIPLPFVIYTYPGPIP